MLNRSILAACTAAASLAMMGGVALAQDKDPVKIAALYNLTGGMSSIDAPALNGAKLRAKQINEAGGVLDGRMIEILAIDTQTDQVEAAKGAQKALSEDVIAGIGYGDTTYTMAAAPLFNGKGVPFVTSGATHPMLPHWVGECMFMTAFGDDDQSYAIADYAIDTLGAKKIAVWTDQSMDFTKGLSRYFKERVEARGGEVAGEDSFMMGDTDFSAQIARLQNMDPKPDAVFISAVPSEAGLTVKQLREAGVTMPIISGDGFDTELVATVPGADLANDVYFSSHTYRADDRPIVTDYIKAYNAEYGRDPENAFSPLGYDAVTLVVEAIKRAGSAEPGDVCNAMKDTQGVEGVTGEISYARDNMVPPKDVAIIGVKNAEFTLLETWKPDMAAQ
jgi:branched-chain amino acid transport system substrate-binding protein